MVVSVYHDTQRNARGDCRSLLHVLSEVLPFSSTPSAMFISSLLAQSTERVYADAAAQFLASR
jgi:hypothetical protein